ncbi:MAG: polyphosphate kinase 1, partial [Mucinivorans sp.]
MKSYLINRELSWLSFNDRVMQEARDHSVPLIQRLRFLGIFSNNLDEFYKVRVASLRRQAAVGLSAKKILSGQLTPVQLLEQIHCRVQELQHTFDNTYADLCGQMEQLGIFIRNEQQLTPEQKHFVRDYFAETVSPSIVPLIVTRSGRLPLLTDDSIYLAVEMCHGKKRQYSILEIPLSKTIPRFTLLPCPQGQTHVIFVDDVIRLCLEDIYFMFDYQTIAAYTFKLTRDAEISFDDDISKSMLEKMEQSLALRTLGHPVRFVYDRAMPCELLKLLLGKLGLKSEENISAGGRYHQMRDLVKFPRVFPTLEYTIPSQVQHPDIKPFTSLLSAIRLGDILLAYPYHNFNHFIDFLREAAIDPKVEEIYITLYRVAERSKVINALINAARNGKQVVVLIELLARFDEQNNIQWTDVLQGAGVRVINGVEGLKVHSKLALVRRREKGQFVGYTYIGTGNMNEATAHIYSDLGLLTAHAGIAQDAMMVFDFLLKNHRRFDPKYLLVSPYSMRKPLTRLIEREIANARAGKIAYIHLKLNNLVDPEIIALLYKASQAGVVIKLIVRSACCIDIGVDGLSDNISGTSIVDMYLEHARVAIFANGGSEKCYIMSADWMVRNLDRRVEVAAPIFDATIIK